MVSLICNAGGRVLFTKGMPKGVFRTTQRLPAGIDASSLRANFLQGILRISMRKQM